MLVHDTIKDEHARFENSEEGRQARTEHKRTWLQRGCRGRSHSGNSGGRSWVPRRIPSSIRSQTLWMLVEGRRVFAGDAVVGVRWQDG